MWAARGGTEVTPEALAQQAMQADVQGVTLLGGEPFEQSEGLARFADLVKRQGLSVMAFTGHLLEDLEVESQPGARALLAQVDLLIDGPYVADQKDLQRPWVGSTNQRFHFLTDRYRHLGQNLTAVPDRIELRIAATGEVTVNGWATVDQLDDLLADSASPLGRGNVR